MHIFYIEKYQEFAYFDIFLVFVQKNRKMRILDQFDAKRNFQGEIRRTAKGEGLNCTTLLKTVRRGAICKTRKVQGESAIRENLDFWIFLLRAAALFSADSRIFMISTQFKEESCKSQKTKLVRKRSRINPGVESRETAQYGERKLEQKSATVLEISAVAAF